MLDEVFSQPIRHPNFSADVEKNRPAEENQEGLFFSLHRGEMIVLSPCNSPLGGAQPRLKNGPDRHDARHKGQGQIDLLPGHACSGYPADDERSQNRTHSKT